MKIPFPTELIIFDLDGTLINSIPDITDALNHVSIQKKREIFTEKRVAELVGEGVTNLIACAFAIDKSQPDFKTYFKLFLDYYESHHSNLSYLYDGVLETLRHFHSKKLVILSNKLEPLTQQIVKDFDLDQYFSLVLGAIDGRAKKPSADPIQDILKRLNISSEQAIMVGDSEPDILAAKNAGIKSVAVTYGYRSKAQLSRLNPDWIIGYLSELMKLIQ